MTVVIIRDPPALTSCPSRRLTKQQSQAFSYHAHHFIRFSLRLASHRCQCGDQERRSNSRGRLATSDEQASEAADADSRPVGRTCGTSGRSAALDASDIGQFRIGSAPGRPSAGRHHCMVGSRTLKCRIVSR